MGLRKSKFPKLVRSRCRIQTTMQGLRSLDTFTSYTTLRPKSPGCPTQHRSLEYQGTMKTSHVGTLYMWNMTFMGNSPDERFPKFNSNLKRIERNNYCIFLIIHSFIQNKFTKDPLCVGTNLCIGNKVMKKRKQRNYPLLWRISYFLVWVVRNIILICKQNRKVTQ